MVIMKQTEQAGSSAGCWIAKLALVVHLIQQDHSTYIYWDWQPNIQISKDYEGTFPVETTTVVQVI